jgi:hypothetical protein
MHVAAIGAGVVFLAGVLLDAFQTIILPRRPVGRLRITRVFFLLTWAPWVWLGGRLRPAKLREQMYSLYGPAALLVLFVVWALSLTLAYALVYFGLGMPFNDPVHPVTAWGQMKSCLYVSGTTIFTLGLGDVQPAGSLARMLIVLEAGTGLGFVALVIGYVPVLYGAFSSREIAVALLDARAGSPPTAGELLSRHDFKGGDLALMTLLAEWERWCAATLETHISYPLAIGAGGGDGYLRAADYDGRPAEGRRAQHAAGAADVRDRAAYAGGPWARLPPREARGRPAGCAADAAAG